MVNLRQLWKKLLLSLVFMALVVAGLSVYANFGELKLAFMRFSLWYLPLLLALSMGNYIVRFFKWDFYLSVLDISLSKGQSFSIFLAGLIMSISSGKFGEVLKSFLIKAVNKTSISKSAPVVLAERLTDFMGLVVLVALGFSTSRASLDVLIISIAIIVVVLLVVGSPRLARTIIATTESLTSRLCEAAVDSELQTKEDHSLRARLKRFFLCFPEKLSVAYDSIASLMTPRRLLWATFLSVISWTFEGIAFLFLLQGYGYSFELTKALFIYSFSVILGAITMLPGGVGLTETSLSGLLILNNLPKPEAVAITLIIRFTTLWFAVALGAVTLFFFLRRHQQVHEVASPEASL